MDSWRSNPRPETGLTYKMLNLEAFTTDQLLRAADRFATFGDWDRHEKVRNELETRGVRP